MSKYQKGQSLIELILAAGLAMILLPALLTGLIASREGKSQQTQRIQAAALVKQAAEAVRSIKETNWTTFAVDGTYYPYIDPVTSTWKLGSPPLPTVDGFNRQIVISDVYRDGSGKIVTTGGTLDPSTKKIVITVSWSSPNLYSITSTMYLSRLENLISLDTTTETTQFGGGDAQSVAVVASAPQPTPTPFDGQVELGHGGQGDWCNPALNNNLMLILNGNSTTNAIWTSAGNNTGFDYAYIVTGGSASTNFPFIKVTDTNPPVPSVQSTFNQYKAAGIFGDATGTYGYLALTSPASKQVSIIALSSNQEISYIQTNDQGQSHSIFVSGNTLFFTSGKNGPDYLYAYDISTITNPTRLGASTNRTLLHGIGKKIYVVNGKAYVATDSSTNQLDIIDVSNPANLPASPNNSVNLGNSEPAVDLYVNPSGSRTYITTHVTSSSQTDSAHSDFFIINTADFSIWGHYNTYPMNPNGVTVVPGDIGIIVGQKVTTGNPYQAMYLIGESQANPLLPSCGNGLPNASFDINGLAGVLENDGDAYSYIITNENSTPTFRILPGGPGGAVGNIGTFTSRPFIPGSLNSTAFNKIIVNYSQPQGTSLTFKVASADHGSDGTCATANYNFVGPALNGTPYPTPTGTLGPTTNIVYALPFGTASSYTNPGFCFKYQASFTTTDRTRTPILYDVTLNYSP